VEVEVENVLALEEGNAEDNLADREVLEVDLAAVEAINPKAEVLVVESLRWMRIRMVKLLWRKSRKGNVNVGEMHLVRNGCSVCLISLMRIRMA